MSLTSLPTILCTLRPSVTLAPILTLEYIQKLAGGLNAITQTGKSYSVLDPAGDGCNSNFTGRHFRPESTSTESAAIQGGFT